MPHIVKMLDHKICYFKNLTYFLEYGVVIFLNLSVLIFMGLNLPKLYVKTHDAKVKYKVLKHMRMKQMKVLVL